MRAALKEKQVPVTAAEFGIMAKELSYTSRTKQD